MLFSWLSSHIWRQRREKKYQTLLSDYCFGSECINNPLGPEFGTHCTVRKTGDLNRYPLLCMLLVYNFRWHAAFSASHCMTFGAKGLKWTELYTKHKTLKNLLEYPLSSYMETCFSLLRCHQHPFPLFHYPMTQIFVVTLYFLCNIQYC